MVPLQPSHPPEAPVQHPPMPARGFGEQRGREGSAPSPSLPETCLL